MPKLGHYMTNTPSLSSKSLQSGLGVFKKCKLLCYNEKNILIEEFLMEVTDSIKCYIFKNSF